MRGLMRCSGARLERHGGRQSLVVPLVNGNISAPYLAWLRVFIPDIVHLVTTTIAELPELYPAPTARRCEWSPRSEILRRKMVTYLEPRFGTQSPYFTFLAAVSQDCVRRIPGSPRGDSRSLSASGGRWDHHRQLWNIIRRLRSLPAPSRELADLVKPLMLTPRDAPEDRWRLGIKAEEYRDGYEAFGALTKSGRTITLA